MSGAMQFRDSRVTCTVLSCIRFSPRSASQCSVHFDIQLNQLTQGPGMLLAPTGALVVMMVYYTNIYQPTFSDFHLVH